MHKVLDWVKSHPKTAGGILLGLVVLLIFSLRGGSTAAPQTVVMQQPTDTAQNAALMAAQLNAQVQTAGINAAAGVQNAQTAGAITVQSLQSNNATQVALTNIASQADTVKYVSNLQAQVANNQTSAAKDINDAQMSAAQQIAAINATAQTTLGGLAASMNQDNNATSISLSGIAAGVANNQIASSQVVNLAQINAAQNIAFNTNATNQNIAGMSFATAQNLAAQKYNSIANAINIASADQWGGGFVNPGIAQYLANAG